MSRAILEHRQDMTMTSLLKSSDEWIAGFLQREAASEGARRATGEAASLEAARRDPEVVAIASCGDASSLGSDKRRLLILEADRCKECRYAGGVPATRAHLLLDDRELGSASKSARGRRGGTRAERRGGRSRMPRHGKFSNWSRDNARLRHKLARAEADHRRPKKNCAWHWGCRPADDRNEDA